MYATILVHPSGYNYSRHLATSIAMQAMMTIPRMGQEKQMISQELYQEILNSCGLSQAMKEHLDNQDLSKHEVIKLLVNAPVALTKKLALREQKPATEALY